MPKKFNTAEERRDFLRGIAKLPRPNSRGGHFRKLHEDGNIEELRKIAAKGGRVTKGAKD